MHKNKAEKKVKIPKIQTLQTFEQRVSKNIGSVTSLYIHTTIFCLAFILIIIGYSTEKVLLVLTTLVSLEAIYLSIFIQMAVNKNTQSLEEVEEDLDEIQEDIDDIQEGVDSIEEDIEEIEEDVDDIEEGDTKREKVVNDKFTKIDNQLNLILEELKNLRK